MTERTNTRAGKKRAFTVRIPQNVYDKLVHEAELNKRSLGAQVEHDLEQLYL